MPLGTTARKHKDAAEVKKKHKKTPHKKKKEDFFLFWLASVKSNSDNLTDCSPNLTSGGEVSPFSEFQAKAAVYLREASSPQLLLNSLQKTVSFAMTRLSHWHMQSLLYH